MIVSHRLDPQKFTSRFGLVQFGVAQKFQQIIKQLVIAITTEKFAALIS